MDEVNEVRKGVLAASRTGHAQLTLRQFLSTGLDEKTPDHVTISRTRRLIDGETYQLIFTWVLELLARGGLIKGKTIGVDSTTLEANAALEVDSNSGQWLDEGQTWALSRRARSRQFYLFEALGKNSHIARKNSYRRRKQSSR